jgi:predicted transcriptional regulator
MGDGRKRDRVELIHDILKVIQDAGGQIKPTHLLYKANLSHEALKRYVGELQASGLVTETDKGDRRMFVLTEQGHRFLQQYQQFKNFSDAFGI